MPRQRTVMNPEKRLLESGLQCKVPVNLTSLPSQNRVLLSSGEDTKNRTVWTAGSQLRSGSGGCVGAMRDGLLSARRTAVYCRTAPRVTRLIAPSDSPR